MSTFRFDTESAKLKKTIGIEFGLDIMENTRARKYVDARMIYSLILKERGYGCTLISRSINKTHCTVLHYLRIANDLLGQLPELRKIYSRVKKSHSVEYDVVYDMGAKELREYIYELRDSVDTLSLQLKELKTTVDTYESNGGRFSKLFFILKSRVPEGKEEKLQSKLIQLINEL
jgi:hypothetical protein